MPLTISRVGHSRGLPVALGFGKCGAITRHSASVRSVWYRVTMRLCCRRVVGVHTANPRLVQEPLGVTAGAMTQPFSKTASNKGLGACLNSRCSILGESDSTLGYEQVFSPLEYRSDAASAAECAGLRSKRPCLAVYRRVGAGEPRSQGDHGQLCERARAAAV